MSCFNQHLYVPIMPSEDRVLLFRFDLFLAAFASSSLIVLVVIYRVEPAYLASYFVLLSSGPSACRAQSSNPAACTFPGIGITSSSCRSLGFRVSRLVDTFAGAETTHAGTLSYGTSRTGVVCCKNKVYWTFIVHTGTISL